MDMEYVCMYVCIYVVTYMEVIDMVVWFRDATILLHPDTLGSDAVSIHN